MLISTNIKRFTLGKNEETGFKLVLFCFWPFGSFLYSLRNAASMSSYIIYFLFGVVFCWHMNPTSLDNHADMIEIMRRVITYDFTWSDICTQAAKYFTFTDETSKELYENFLIFLSKSLSPNPHVFFALASIPYLIFMLKSLRLITTDKKFETSLYGLMILALFVMPRDIITVQNPRFTTGVWIAVYATIKFFQEKHPSIKYVLLIAITPLIHSGFWAYLIIFAASIILSRYPKLIIWLLYISVPFSYLSYDLLTAIDFSFLPPTIETWANRYLSDKSFSRFVLNEGASGFYWVQLTSDFLRKTVYLIIPLVLWKYKDVPDVKEKFGKLFNYYIFFFAFVNFIQFVPVLGERYMWIVQILSIYVFYKIVYPKHKKLLLLILCTWAYYIFRRYFYASVLSCCVPYEIFYMPLPNLIADFWGVTGY